MLASLLFAPFFWSFTNYDPHIIDHYLPIHLYLLATPQTVCSRLNCVSFLFFWDDDDKKGGWNEKLLGYSERELGWLFWRGRRELGVNQQQHNLHHWYFRKGPRKGCWAGWVSVVWAALVPGSMGLGWLADG